MKNRTFARTGCNLSPIAFGAMRIEADASGISRVLLEALERGVNMIDTARNYGESEAVVGRTLKDWRGERPFIATKVKPLDVTNWRRYVEIEDQFTPESIRASVECSLRTLGAERIDLLQLHQWYYLWSFRDEWRSTFEDLKAEGKVRFIGVSAQDHEHDAVLKLVDEQTVDSVQIVMNAFESRPLVSLLPLAKMREVGVIARCVFDHSGMLAAGATRESLTKDVKLSNASPELVTEVIRRVDALKDLAESQGLELAEMCLRFVLHAEGVNAVAVSLADSRQLDTALRAAESGPLPQKLADEIRVNHVWVKNFYYFSAATVDGNKA